MISKRFSSLGLVLAAAVITLATLFVPMQSALAVSDTMYVIPAKKATYEATINALTPASSATDIVTLKGSATKMVRLVRVECYGTATAQGIWELRVVKRSTADSGGTGAAMTIVPHDTTTAAATAVATKYTANPTLGTTIGVMRGGFLNLGPATSNTVNAAPLVYDFAALQEQAPVLHGVAQMLSLNANAASAPSGAAVNCTVEWTEE